MYAISRTKAALNAWYWQVSLRRRGTPYAKRVYDQKHGGTAKALNAAITWRDRTLVLAGILTRREFCQQKQSNNTSGLPGFISSPRSLHRWGFGRPKSNYQTDG